MGMPELIEPIRWTPEMVRALPDDGNRYEVVRGTLLVTPAPSRGHQRVLGRLYLALGNWLAVHPVGELLWSPADITAGSETLVQPDLFVVEQGAAGRPEWPQLRELLLVIEVLSPSTRRHDRTTKRRCYQEAGVPTYWILAPEEGLVEVWTPADLVGRVEREALRWRPVADGPAFEVEVQGLFR